MRISDILESSSRLLISDGIFAMFMMRILESLDKTHEKIECES